MGKTEIEPRAKPCTTCGRPVVRIRIYSDAVGHGRGKLAADYARHDGRAYLGERVDAECNLPAYRLP